MKYRILSLLLALVLFVSLCACNQIGDNNPDQTDPPINVDTPPKKEPYPVSIYNETFEDAPESVISLSPATTQMLAHIGVTNKLVGISEYCSLPGLELETVGSPANPDINKIIELKPRVVITLSPLASTDKINLSQHGITLLQISEPESYAELCDIYISLCKLFYGEIDYRASAIEALKPLDDGLKEIKAEGINNRFLCVVGTHKNGLIVAGGDTLESDLLSIFGENVLKFSGAGYAGEDVLEIADPSIIFAYDSVDRDDIRDYYKNQKIIFISEEAFSQPSVELAAELYEIFEELK